MPAIEWSQFALGIVLCLLGWMLYWVGIHLTGALVGAAGGVAVSYMVALLVEVQPEAMVWILPLGGVIGFFIGMLLIRGLHRFFFFFVGAIIGLAIGQQSYHWAFEHTEWAALHPTAWQVVMDVAGAILGGLLFLRTSKWVVAALTSLAGALLVATSIQDPLALYGILPLAAASFFWQVGLLRKFGKTRRQKELIEEDED